MEEILAHVTSWMNMEDIMLCEISQLQKDKYFVTPFTWIS